MGFESTGAGREYTLRVEGEGDPRVFVLVIPHDAFASKAARFQDGPDLCFATLQREIEADKAATLEARVVLTLAQLTAYRESHTKRPPDRGSRPPGSQA
jgi:hypothetical protein